MSGTEIQRYDASQWLAWIGGRCEVVPDSEADHAQRQSFLKLSGPPPSEFQMHNHTTIQCVRLLPVLRVLWARQVPIAVILIAAPHRSPGPWGVGLALCAMIAGIASETVVPRPRLTGLTHVACYAGDLERARIFYREFLGFPERKMTDLAGNDTGLVFTINSQQFIEIYPLVAPATDHQKYLGMSVDDAAAWCRYFKSRGVSGVTTVTDRSDGGRELFLIDPDGHRLHLVQQPAVSEARYSAGAVESVSQQLGHVGILVSDLARSLVFYRDMLGMKEIWRGGPTHDELRWVKLEFPDGPGQVEFILMPAFPPPERRGQQNHLCFDVADVTQTKVILDARPAEVRPVRPFRVTVGQDRKRQMSLYDPDGTRVEFMEFTTVDAVGTDTKTVPGTEVRGPTEPMLSLP